MDTLQYMTNIIIFGTIHHAITGGYFQTEKTFYDTCSFLMCILLICLVCVCDGNNADSVLSSLLQPPRVDQSKSGPVQALTRPQLGNP